MKTTEAHEAWLRRLQVRSLRTVFDHLPGVMFFAKDLEGRFTMANQAFAQGSRVAGIQFHLEVTAANARDWFLTEQPKPARYVQAPKAILAELPHFAGNNRLMLKLLENLEAAA